MSFQPDHPTTELTKSHPHNNDIINDINIVKDKSPYKLLKEAKFNPETSKIIKIFESFYKKKELARNKEFIEEVCNLASTVSKAFHPEEIELIFKVSSDNGFIHKSLLESIADSIIYSYDLSHFKSHIILSILESISKLKKFKYHQFKNMLINDDGKLGFPSEIEFTNVLVSEILESARLEDLKENEISSLFFSMAILNRGRHLDDIIKYILKSKIYTGFGNLEIAKIVYASCLIKLKNPLFIQKTCYSLLNHNHSSIHIESIDLTIIIYGLSKLSNVENIDNTIIKDVFNTKIKEALSNPNFVLKMKEREIACVIYAMGKCNLNKHKLILTLLCNTLCLPKRFKNLSNHHIISILNGISNLKFKDTRFIEIFSNKIIVNQNDYLNYFKTRELCSILHSFANLQLHKGWIINIIIKEIIRKDRIFELSPLDKAIIVYSIGKLKFHDHRILCLVKNDWYSEFTLRNFSNHALTMTSYGLGQLKEKQSLKLILNELIKRINDLPSVSISNATYAMLMTQLKDKGILSIFGMRMIDLCRNGHVTMTQLATVIYAFGKLNYKNDDTVISSLMGFVMKNDFYKKMTNYSISNIILGLGYLKRGNIEDVKSLAWELLDKKRLASDLTSNHCIQICNCIYSFGRLGIRDANDIISKLLEILLNHGIDDLQSPGLCQIVTGLSMIKYDNKMIYKVLLEEANRRHRFNKIKPSEISMIFEAAGKIDLNPVFSRHLLNWMMDSRFLKRFSFIDIVRMKNSLKLLGQEKLIKLFFKPT